MALVKYMAGVPLKYTEFQSKNIFSHSLKYSYIPYSNKVIVNIKFKIKSKVTLRHFISAQPTL